MSKLFVDDIVHQSSQGSGTITIGASGETINVVGTLQNNGAGVGGTNTPYFFAYRSASYTISSGTWTKVIFDAEDFDTASGFNVSTGTYTVQTAGKYYFQFSLRSQAANGASSSRRTFCYLERTRSGTTAQRGNAGFDFSDNYITSNTVDGSAILDCEANDTICVYLYHLTTSGDVTVYEGSYRPTYFLGYKIIE